MAATLTTTGLRDRVARRTGLPKTVVSNVLDAMIVEMRLEMMQQGEIYLKGLVRIKTFWRPFYDLSGQAQTRIGLSIRPVRSFRKALSELLPPS